MEIRCFASSSRANLYTVDNGTDKVLLEAGLPIKDIKKALNYGLSSVSFCLVTHEHQDHSRAAGDLMAAGVEVYMSEGTAKALGLSGHRLHIVRAGEKFTVGSWSALAVEAQHDAEEALSFLLLSATGERVLFATDTFYLKNRFAGLTHILIETNYAADILRENVKNGTVPPGMKNRILKSHFSLENVKGFLKANDLSRVEEIWLIHLSDGNSDAERFKREVMEITGRPVFVAGR